MLLIISRYAGVFLRNTLKPSVLSLTECHSFLTPYPPTGGRRPAPPRSPIDELHRTKLHRISKQAITLPACFRIPNRGTSPPSVLKWMISADCRRSAWMWSAIPRTQGCSSLVFDPVPLVVTRHDESLRRTNCRLFFHEV